MRSMAQGPAAPLGEPRSSARRSWSPARREPRTSSPGNVEDGYPIASHGYAAIRLPTRGDDEVADDVADDVADATRAIEAASDDRAVDNVYDGAIVELRLDGPASAASTGRALPRIIPELREQGYRFVTIPEMLRPCP